MGGAAVTGISVTNLTGAGFAVCATVAGILDIGADGEVIPDLKERFLVAWKRDLGKNVEE
jgi:hypothetical protein